MKRSLVQKILKVGQLVELDDLEAKHLVQVLRLTVGTPIEVMDGQGHCGRGSLEKVGKNWAVRLSEIDAPLPRESELNPITLWMAILKGDAMEWVIEKAVELGVDQLVPVMTKNTVVQIKNKGPEAFLERWTKIANQSLKQCERRNALTLHAPNNFEDLIQNALSSEKPVQIFWCDEQSRTLPNLHLGALAFPKNIQFVLLIGPEGGFSESERQRLLQLTELHQDKIKRVSLGHLVLRAETAAISGLSIIAGGIHGNIKGQN